MKILTNKELTDAFFKIVHEKNPEYFIEVGAFEATASKHVESMLPNCCIFAYEANPYNYENFKEEFLNCNFTYINKAISNFTGTTRFYLQTKKNKNNSNIYVRGNNSLAKRTKSSLKYEEVEVECDTLDNLHFDKDSTYALWIDAEGKGFEVLEGAIKILENTFAILIEVEDKDFWVDQKLDSDVIDFLKSQGFTATLRDQEYPRQYNIIFERNETR